MKLTLLSLLAALAAAPVAHAQQQLCGQYDYHAAGNYYFNNNLWGKDSGSGSQCLTVTTSSNDGATWSAQWQWSGGENNVKSYPYVGRNLGTPRLVSQINTIPSKAEWSYSGSNIRANVAYDLFTASNPNHSTSSGDYELMVWLGRLGNVYPIGSSVGQVSVGGRTWELFDGYNGAMHVYSFVAPSQVNNFDGDIKQFFSYLANSKGFPSSSQYLITNQFGSEPFTGSGTFTNHWFSTWTT